MGTRFGDHEAKNSDLDSNSSQIRYAMIILVADDENMPCEQTVIRVRAFKHSGEHV